MPVLLALIIEMLSEDSKIACLEISSSILQCLWYEVDFDFWLS